jgi:hypothetical protein
MSRLWWSSFIVPVFRLADACEPRHNQSQASTGLCLRICIQHVKILRPSPKIEIRLQGEHTGLDSYTTGDVVQGSALITAPHNLPLGGVDIYLQCTCVHVTTKIINFNSQAGISQTKFYGAINHARSKAQHTFLSVHQPTNEFKSTIPNILRKDQEYEYPFTFTIPAQLPSRSCNHLAQNESVKHLHSMLPSTLGDSGCENIDDFTSDMARISYRIKVKLSDQSTSKTSETPLLTVTKCIWVVLKTMEEFPAEMMRNTLCWTHRQVLLGNARFVNQPSWLSIDVMQPKPIQLPNFRTPGQRQYHGNYETTICLQGEFKSTQTSVNLQHTQSHYLVQRNPMGRPSRHALSDIVLSRWSGNLQRRLTTVKTKG